MREHILNVEPEFHAGRQAVLSAVLLLLVAFVVVTLLRVFVVKVGVSCCLCWSRALLSGAWLGGGGSPSEGCGLFICRIHLVF